MGIGCMNPTNTVVSMQAFVFASKWDISQQMIQAEPDGFEGCRYILTAGLNGTLIAIGMDEMYCVEFDSNITRDEYRLDGWYYRYGTIFGHLYNFHTTIYQDLKVTVFTW